MSKTIFLLFSALLIFSFNRAQQPFLLPTDSTFNQVYQRYQSVPTSTLHDGDYARWKRFERQLSKRVGQSGKFKEYENFMRQFTAGVSTGNTNAFMVPNNPNLFSNWTEHGPYQLNNYPLSVGQLDQVQVDKDDPTGNTIYVCSEYGGIFKTTDGGQNWINFHTDMAFGTTAVKDFKLVKDPVTSVKYLFALVGSSEVNGFATPFNGVYKMNVNTAVWQNISGNLICAGGLEQKLSSVAYKILVDPTNLNNVYVVTNKGLFFTCSGSCPAPNIVCSNVGSYVWYKANINEMVSDIAFDYSIPGYKALYCSGKKLWHTPDISTGVFSSISTSNNSFTNIFDDLTNTPSGLPVIAGGGGGDIAICTSLHYPNTVFINLRYGSQLYLIRYDKNSSNTFPNNYVLLRTSNINFIASNHLDIHVPESVSASHLVVYNLESLLFLSSFPGVTYSYGGLLQCSALEVFDLTSNSVVANPLVGHGDAHAFDFTPNDTWLIGTNDGGVYKLPFYPSVGQYATSINGLGLNVALMNGGQCVWEKTGKDVIVGSQDNHTYGSNNFLTNAPWTFRHYMGDGSLAEYTENGDYVFSRGPGHDYKLFKSASNTVVDLCANSVTGPYSFAGGHGWPLFRRSFGKSSLYMCSYDLFRTSVNNLSSNCQNTWSQVSDLFQTNIANMNGACYQYWLSDVDYTPDFKTIYGSVYANAANWSSTCVQALDNTRPFIKTTVGGLNNPDVNTPCTSGCWSAPASRGQMKLINLSTAVCLNQNNPNEVWAASNGYWDGTSANNRRVVYSSDGGVTWSDFTFGLLNFPVNRLISRQGSDYELFAATDYGVFYINRNMVQNNQNWMRVGNNLPYGIVNDIQVDECNNKLYAYCISRGMWSIDLPPVQLPCDMPVVTLAANTTYTGDQYFLHSLKVPAGVKLSVTNANVRMGPFTKIEVEPGGVLEVNNSTIQSYCDYNMWTGIVAKGVASQPQSHSAPNGGYLNHGYVVVNNNSKLKDAEAALSSENGGVVVALNSRFENNRKDVQFLAYAYPNHQSVFVNCVFETNAQLKAVNNTLDAHVSAWAVDNVKFQGCTFQNIAPFGANGGYRGNGIYSIDATCNLISYCAGGTGCAQTPATAGRNLFKNLNYGVYAETTVNPLLTYNVVNSDFDGCNYGAYFKSVDLAGVQYCNFTNIPNGIYAPPGTPYGVRSPYGLYYDNCQNFFCEKNTFKSVVTQATNNLGLVVNGAGSNATRGYYCDFTDLKVGSAAYYDNYNTTAGVGLRFNCNQYKANGFDVSLLGGTQSTATDMDHVQGSYNPLSNPPTFTNTVRNLYSAVCLPGATNQWFDDRTTAWSFLHANHSTQSGNGGTYFTAPQSGCYPAGKLTIQNIVGILNRQNVCPVSPLLGTTSGGGSGGGGSASAGMSALTQSISSAEQNVMALTPVSTVSSQNLSASTQGAGSGNAAPSPAQAEQAHARTELQRLYTQKLRAFVSDSMYRNADSVQVLLQKSPFGDKEQKRLAQYLHTRRFTQAQALLNTLQNQPGLSGYAQLKQIQLNALQQPNGLQSIKANAALKAQILQLARADFDAGQKQAQSLAKLLWNEPFYEPILLPEQAGSAAARIQQAPVTETVTEPFTHQALLQIVPNPSAERTAILYRLPEGVVNGQIVIQNELGKEVHRYEVIASLRQLNLTTATLHNGIYLVTLICGDKVVKSEKLIVNK